MKEVTGMALRPVKSDRELEITLKTKEGEYPFVFGKKMARQLMRAIFLQLGTDPRLGE